MSQLREPESVNHNPVVLAMTGASGSVYGTRLLDVLLANDIAVHLVVSPAATQVFDRELGISVSLDELDIETLLEAGRDVCGAVTATAAQMRNAVVHGYKDFSAGIASGSFKTSGMVVCPCSMGTLANLAHGVSGNLIHRAADVHLKERRKLIVVPRETPLGTIQLRNMTALSEAGAVILPAMPGFYHGPESIADLVDFIVARICDQLQLGIELVPRWGKQP